MKKFIHLTLLVCLMACESTIYPELDAPAEIIVVDAWLKHDQPDQFIYITRSQGYFDQTEPEMVSGAVVTIKDLTSSKQYIFLESEKGYVFSSESVFGEIGHDYLLTVQVAGELFESRTHLGEVPPVDSVVFSYNPEDYNILSEYFSAEFYAQDLVGAGDTYWIKAWKNGVLLNKPSEINIAYDAGFGAGQEVDGVVFHKTIRKDYINPLVEREDRANYYLPPYDIGDSVYVEIHSIDPAAYDYLSAVKTQTDRPGGFSELFAVPLANVSTNIYTTNPNSNTAVAGFFNVSAVAGGGKRLTAEEANQLSNQ
ncbi:DUF4249 domain-containing protein [Marinoscillum pacificum]|uniref:DUF4249 domain-containing protein n=1 Tax=Marinoscillum pacificum TaxID=392723 RepID=UPI002157CCA1|nr:DUF4249 domain-containing protein [Marinoscillum pacificum]